MGTYLLIGADLFPTPLARRATMGALLALVLVQFALLSSSAATEEMRKRVVRTKGDVATQLFNIKPSSSIQISDSFSGGTFAYRPSLPTPDRDNVFIFKSRYGGYWERQVSDTVKVAWFGLKSGDADNAPAIRRAIQSAIDKSIPVVAFPSKGVYKVMSSNSWVVGDRLNLQIDGKGSTIEVDKRAADVSQETYVLAFRCTDLNSFNSRIILKNLSIRAPGILPRWTETDYSKHKLVIAIQTDGIHRVGVEKCTLNDICGYGIRIRNFSDVRIDKVIENNVGGHFPIENTYDSFGDGIWLGHYDVETIRASRKTSYARISNCVIKGYNTATNGNFASRCGITVEGFNSHAPDIIVKVDVINSTISEYDRNLHVEGISSNIKYTNCTIRNFYGMALVVKSDKTALAYDNCTVEGQLPANPRQERLGLGGAMQFESYFDLMLTNSTKLKFSRPASFRANIYLQDKSVLDMGGSDVFFDHTNLYVKSGGALINIPARVPRGYNMYGGKVQSDGGIFQGKGLAGVLHGENMEEPMIKNSKLVKVRLLFAGRYGTREIR